MGVNEGDDSLETLYKLDAICDSHLVAGDGEIYDPGYIVIDGKVVITGAGNND